MKTQIDSRFFNPFFFPFNKGGYWGILLIIILFTTKLVASDEIVKDKILTEQTTTIFSQEYQLLQNQNSVGYLKIRTDYVPSDTKTPYQTQIESYSKIPLLFFEKETINHETEYYDKDFHLVYSSAETVSQDVITWTVCERRNNKIYISLKDTTGKKKAGSVSLKPTGYTPVGMRYYMLTNDRFKQKNTYRLFSLDKKNFKWQDCTISVDKLQDVVINDKKQKLYPIQVRIIMQGVFLTLYITDTGEVVYGNFLGINVVPTISPN